MKIHVVVFMSTLFLLSLAIMSVSGLAIIEMFMGAGGSLNFLIAFPLSAGACYHLPLLCA